MEGTGNVAVLSADSHVTAAADSVEQHLVASSMVLLPIAAAGVITSDGRGGLYVAAWSSEPARALASMQVERGSGPGLEAYRTGRPITVEDIGLTRRRWSAFARLATEHHFASAYALPLLFHDEPVGALMLLCGESPPMSSYDLAVGHALADVAAIGIAQQRTLSLSESLNQQLQTALDSRIVIEQAKGILAARGAMDMGDAFSLLRSHARKTRQRLTDLAHAVVDGADTSAILSRSA